LAAIFGARVGAGLGFFAGGVFESKEASFRESLSMSEFSSSESGFARFFALGAGADFATFSVVCLVAAGFALAAVGFFTGAFAFYEYAKLATLAREGSPSM